MKNFIAFLLLLTSFCVFSQTKHEDGAFKEYYKDGQLKREGFYKNDKKVSVWKDYYENGNIKKVYRYNNDGESSGIEEVYAVEGNLISETKPAQSGGLISKHYFDNGKPSIIYALIPSENNKYFIKAGGYKEYYENDSLKIESLFSNNELNGNWIRYYETGEKEWEVVYFEGYRQGSYKHFYKNGNIELEGFNVADSKNGEEKRYDEKGNLVWKGFYLNDDFDNDWVQYDSIGNTLNKLSYNKGKLKKSDTTTNLIQTVIPDGNFEHVPIYPGCEIFPGNNKKRDCMSKKVQEFVNKNFNTKALSGTGITGKARINITFKIDKTGKIIDIRAKAPHPNLEKAAIDVVSKLPAMKPGKQKGKPVTVPYSLPVIFQVNKDESIPPTAYHYGSFNTN